MIQFRILTVLTLIFGLQFSPWAGAAVTVPSDPKLKQIREQIQSEACSVLLGSGLAPMHPGAPPVRALSWLDAFVTSIAENNFSAFQRRKEQQKREVEYQRAVEEYNLNVRILEIKRRESIDYLDQDSFLTRFPGDVTPIYAETFETLRARAKQMIAEATTPEQLDRIDQYYMRNRSGLDIQASALQKAKTEARKTISTKRQVQLRSADDRKLIETIVAEAIKRLSLPTTLAEVTDIQNQALEDIQDIEEEFQSSELQRRQRELRFDLKEEGNSPAILKAFLAQVLLFQNSNLSLAEVAALSKRMERKPKIKAFVYRELQLARRLFKVAQDEADGDIKKDRILGGIALRISNDLWALKQIASDRKADPILELTLLRQALFRLNDPQVLGPLVKGGLHHLSLFERESVIWESTTKNELRFVILASTLDLKLSVPAPTPPKAPSKTPPTPPKVPSRVTSRSEAERVNRSIAQYNIAVSGWSEAWKRYKREEKNYNEVELPKYKKRHAQLVGAHKRRVAARRSVVTFLADTHPQAFRNGSSAQVYSSWPSGRSREQSYSNSGTDDSGNLWFWLWWMEASSDHHNSASATRDWNAVYASDAYNFGASVETQADALKAYGFNESTKAVTQPVEMELPDTRSVSQWGATDGVTDYDRASSNAQDMDDIGNSDMSPTDMLLPAEMPIAELEVLNQGALGVMEMPTQVEMPDFKSLEAVPMPETTYTPSGGYGGGVSVDTDSGGSNWPDTGGGGTSDFGDGGGGISID